MPYHADLSTKGLVWDGPASLGWSGLVWSGSQGRVAAVSIARQPPLSHAKIFPEQSSDTPLLGCSIATLRSLQASSVGYAAYWATYAGTVTARAPAIPQLQTVQPTFECRKCQECVHVPSCASTCLYVPPLTPPKAARRIAMGESGRRAFVPQIIRTAVALLFAPFACLLTP